MKLPLMDLRIDLSILTQGETKVSLLNANPRQEGLSIYSSIPSLLKVSCHLSIREAFLLVFPFY